MSRSIRHGSSWPQPPGGGYCCAGTRPGRSLHDLRYSDAETALAASEGRRAMPSRVTPSTDNPCSKGKCGDFRPLNSFYATAQSRVRASERDALRAISKALSADGDPDDVDLGELGLSPRRIW